MTSKWRSSVLRVASRLEELDYFQLLNLSKDASSTEIRRGFRRLAQHYHPDRLGGSEDSELRQAVSAIYRRMTEAYSALRDPTTKAAYIEGLENGELRLDSTKVRSDRSLEAQQQVNGSWKAALPAAGRFGGGSSAATSEIDALLFEAAMNWFKACETD